VVEYPWNPTVKLGRAKSRLGHPATFETATPMALVFILEFRDVRGSRPGEMRRFDSLQFLRCSKRQSCRTTLRRELLIWRPRSLPPYAMKPSFLNLFMNELIRVRVVPTISASVSCEISGSALIGWFSFP